VHSACHLAQWAVANLDLFHGAPPPRLENGWRDEEERGGPDRRVLNDLFSRPLSLTEGLSGMVALAEAESRAHETELSTRPTGVERGAFRRRVFGAGRRYA
jgi:hypothetical protein